MKTEKQLTEWLSDPRGVQFFGKSFQIRADVLAHLITGAGTLADIARINGVTRQAVYRHAKLARALYPELLTKS